MEGIDLAGVVDSDFQGIQINFAPPRPAGFANFCRAGRGRARLAFLRGGAGQPFFRGAGRGGAGRTSLGIISFLATFYVVNDMLNFVRYVVWWKQLSRTKAGWCTDCPLSLLLCNHLLLTFSQESHVPFNESQKYNFTICGNIFENYSPPV